MISFDEALFKVCEIAPKAETEKVHLIEAIGRVIASDVYSDIDMPPFNKSAMDGYALKKDDLESLLTPKGTIAAGQPPIEFSKGECVAIMTGARVPDCADYVIPVENTIKTGSGEIKVISPTKGSNIAFKAQDIKKNQLIISKNTLLTPAHIAMLAAVGCTEPFVYKKIKTIVFSTGDELVEPNQYPSENQIRNSNGMQIVAQISQMPTEVIYGGIIGDSKEETRKALKNALANNDLIILSGGISMGEFDFIPEILEEEKVELLFKTIKVKPGKPTIFARKGNTTIFALPGNPVSSFIHCNILVKSHIYSRLNYKFEPITTQLPLANEVSVRNPDRLTLIPVSINSNNEVTTVDYHGSAHIHAITKSIGVIRLEIDQYSKPKGEVVNVRLF